MIILNCEFTKTCQARMQDSTTTLCKLCKKEDFPYMETGCYSYVMRAYDRMVLHLEKAAIMKIFTGESEKSLTGESECESGDAIEEDAAEIMPYFKKWLMSV